MPTINDSVQFLKGVGPAFAKKFEKLGILTIRDLLLCYPRKYIDYTQPYTVVSAPYDVECCVRATVLQKEPARRVKGGRVMNRVLAADDSGILALSWFNASYAADKLEVGETYYFEGRIGGALTPRELLHPLVRTEAQVADYPFVVRAFTFANRSRRTCPRSVWFARVYRWIAFACYYGEGYCLSGFARFCRSYSPPFRERFNTRFVERTIPSTHTTSFGRGGSCIVTVVFRFGILGRNESRNRADVSGEWSCRTSRKGYACVL